MCCTLCAARCAFMLCDARCELHAVLYNMCPARCALHHVRCTLSGHSRQLGSNPEGLEQPGGARANAVV